jgi:hypothetical protein
MLHTGTEKPEAIELAKLASGFSGNDRPQRRRRHENKVQTNCTPLERVSQSFCEKIIEDKLCHQIRLGKPYYYAYFYQ